MNDGEHGEWITLCQNDRCKNVTRFLSAHLQDDIREFCYRCGSLMEKRKAAFKPLYCNNPICPRRFQVGLLNSTLSCPACNTRLINYFSIPGENTLFGTGIKTAEDLLKEREGVVKK